MIEVLPGCGSGKVGSSSPQTTYNLSSKGQKKSTDNVDACMKKL